MNQLYVSHKIASGLIIAGAAILVISSAWNDSITSDEVPHIGAGYSYLVARDYRMNPEHPPLVKDLAAIPLLFTKIDNGVFSTGSWIYNNEWRFGTEVLTRTGYDIQAITRLIRLPVILFYILSAWLLFHWVLQRWGAVPAYLTLVLFLFSPTVIAHSRYVTTDVAATWGVLYATYFFMIFLRTPSKKNFLLASLFLGLALLTKFSTLLLVPFFGILAIIWSILQEQNKKIWPVLATLGIATMGFVGIVLPLYVHHTYHHPPTNQLNDFGILRNFQLTFWIKPLEWLATKPILRGLAQYMFGVLAVLGRSSQRFGVFVRGEIISTGSLSYFPIAYFVKESLAWWILGVMASGSAIGVLIKTPLKTDFLRKHFEIIAMILWLLIYWAFSLRSNYNIGVRHLLPLYPFTIILVAVALSNFRFIKNRSIRLFFLGGIGLLIASYIFSSIKIYPYYLTYFNSLAGGTKNGVNTLVDSNLDWGQDLKRLNNWLNAERIDKIELDYFGSAMPQWYLGDKYIPARPLNYKENFLANFKINNQSNGWLAVSATHLMLHSGSSYQALRDTKPETVIGNSIFVYHIDGEN